MLFRSPDSGVWVNYCYAFSDQLGGGEYERPLRPLAGRPVYRVGPQAGQHHTLADAIQHWQRDKQRPGDYQRAVIEIHDSGVYEEPIEIELAAGDRLELRAAQRTRPVVRLLNWYSNRPDSMKIRGDPLTQDNYPDGLAGAPQLLLDGLLITGRSIRISGMIGRVTIRHCTLVPGWSIGSDCEPDSQGQPSIDLADTAADLVVEHSIIGAIRVNENSVDTDPIAVTISDTVLDATSPQLDVLCGPDGQHARVLATIVRTTVLGQVCVAAIELGEALRIQSFVGLPGYEALAEKALVWFRKAMKLNPYDARAHIGYAMCLDWLGRADEAGRYFEEARRLDGNQFTVAARVGWHYFQIEDYATARQWFEKSLQLANPTINSNASIYLRLTDKKLAETTNSPPRKQ